MLSAVCSAARSAGSVTTRCARTAVAPAVRATALQTPAATTTSWPLGHRAEHTLVLCRHGQSTWNLENRFTGWVDVPLTEQGEEEARSAGREIASEGLEFDEVHTSVLRRAIKTMWNILDVTEQHWLPVSRDWRLNERHYGALSGLNKAETQAKHGEEQVLLWRRSFDVPPPALDESHEHYPGHDRRYAGLPKSVLPVTESLKTTGDRVVPWWNEVAVPAIKGGKRLLVVAHGNSLRALVKHLDDIPDDVITGLNIPTGVPLMYKLDDDLRPIASSTSAKPLSGSYLGDQEAIKAAAEAVANQTKG